MNEMQKGLHYRVVGIRQDGSRTVHYENLSLEIADQSDDPEQGLAEVISELTDLEHSTTDAVVQTAPPKVLIVEDQANERELLATCLRLGRVEVATAGNGREAFDFLHDHELPDLVLLDMRMPEVDGPTFIKSLRDDIRLQNLRVFAVTGLSRSDFDSNTLPIDGWFSKPVRIDALMQAVRGGQMNSVATTA
jgi:CheY-like chemotaxis protein